MNFVEISRDEFDRLNVVRQVVFPERAWFKGVGLDIAGIVIQDPIDKDWSYVVMAKDADGLYRYVDGEVSYPSEASAREHLFASGSRLAGVGEFSEELYTSPDLESSGSQFGVLTSIDDEVKKYLKRNPQKLHELSPRRFEELIASILKDLGFEVELTPATRDGGRDIIAYVRNSVCSFLTHIECKRYAPDNKVGVGIVREVFGVHHIRKATKSLIVTTSTFSADAIVEAGRTENQIELKDYFNIKDWLQRY